jgi:predicted transcriptional regulator
VKFFTSGGPSDCARGWRNDIAERKGIRYDTFSMKTPAEIVAAIQALPEAQQDELEALVLGRRALANIDETDRAELVASLSEAEAEIDAGEYSTADELRSAVRSWLGK